MIRFFKKFSLMDAEGAASSAGGAVAPAGGATAAPAEGAQTAEFSVSLGFDSKSETHEERAARELGDSLDAEAGGWVDPAKGTVTYEKTGDTALDLALDFLGKNGYSHQHPAVLAASKGDFSMLEAELAGKNIPGWQQYVNLGKEAFGRGQEQAKVTNDRIKQQCLAATNGDEKLWGDTLAHWSTNADPEEKSAINAALSAGDIVSEAVAHYMVHLFRQAPGVTVNPTSPVLSSSAAPVAAGGAGPLSPREYGAAVQNLARQIGSSNLADSAEYQSLQRRRAAYRG